MLNPYQINKNLRVGVISGSGPEAGLDFCTKLLQIHKEKIGKDYKGDFDAPYIFMISSPKLAWSMYLPKKELFIWRSLKAIIKKVVPLVDYYVITCNTLHYYQPLIEETNLGSKLVSFIDVVKQYILKRNISTVAILGTKQISNLDNFSPYKSLRDITNIEIYNNIEELHNLIFLIKRKGGMDSEVINKFKSILDQLNSADILLACTELPLIKINYIKKNLIDITSLSAQFLVDLAIKK